MDENGPSEFRFRLEARSGYVYVWQQGKATTEVELISMQRVIERAMQAVGSRRVLFDNRFTAPPDEWIRAAMWSWLCASVDRAAMIQESSRSADRAMRTADRNRVAVGGFTGEAEAETWLLSGDAEKSTA